jgi:hypothetical protein
VVWGSVRDVQPARSDIPGETSDGAGQAQGPQPTSMPLTSGGSGKSRRNPGAVIFRIVGRLWIPLLVVVVIAAGGLTVSRLHGLFGSEKSPSYSDTRVDSKPYNPQHLRYEVFGPPGTVALISYFDENGAPQHADNVSLPWSLEFPMTAATGIGSVAAQGDTDSIGCRISVDNVVKSEKVSNEVSAFASCMLKPS